MKHTTHNTQHRASGFTLVETLVAIAILSLAITGPLVIAEKSLSSAIYSQDQITASYLAQDAIEYVRNIRDTNVLNHTGWLNQFGSYTGGGNNYYQVDTTVNYVTDPADAISTCNTQGPNGTTICKPINLESNGLYDYKSSGTPTIFTRTVDIVTDDSGNPTNEVLVTVTVSWQTSIFTQNQSVTVSERLFALGS